MGDESWEGQRRTLRTEELSGDVQGLATDDNDLLAVEKLLGDNACKTAQKVALAVNDDLDSKLNVSFLPCRLLFYFAISVTSHIGQHGPGLK